MTARLSFRGGTPWGAPPGVIRGGPAKAAAPRTVRAEKVAMHRPTAR
jgi:hypothetical protein